MPALTAARESVLLDAANALLNARRTATPVADLPEDLQPRTEQEAFYIQDRMGEAFSPRGGWKVGARGSDAVPFFAPMPAPWMGENGALYRGQTHRLHGVEAEIAFHLRQDLPPRAHPYTRGEVVSAIGTCHPAIEILESAFVDPEAVARECMLADMQMHGGFVAGAPVADWAQIDWAKESVTLILDGSVRHENTASNPAGTDLVRLLLYLANDGAERTGGLKRGDWITTGSWTGVTWAFAGAAVTAKFHHAGNVSLQFESARRD